jgi:hypothetical protein
MKLSLTLRGLKRQKTIMMNNMFVCRYHMIVLVDMTMRPLPVGLLLSGIQIPGEVVVPPDGGLVPELLEINIGFGLSVPIRSFGVSRRLGGSAAWRHHHNRRQPTGGGLGQRGGALKDGEEVTRVRGGRGGERGSSSLGEWEEEEGERVVHSSYHATGPTL